MSDRPTLYDALRRQAATLGDATAVQSQNAADLSYVGLAAQIDRVAEALSAWGLGRGDRVMIQVPNGAESLVTMIGVGAVAVSVVIDPKAGATEVGQMLDFVQPAAMIFQRGVAVSGRALAQQRGLRSIEIVPTPEAGAGTFTFAEAPPPLTAPPAINGPDDLAFLTATSGTTALPKLVPRTQQTMLEGGMIFLDFRDWAINESIPVQVLNFLPIHLAYGGLMCLAGLLSGGRVVCMPAFDPEKIFEWIDVYRPTMLSGPTPFYEQLLAMAPQHQEIIARHSFRYLNVGGAVLPVATREKLDQLFGVPIIKGYGMAEIGTISHIVLQPGVPDPGVSMGRVEDIENMRVMGADGSLLPPGEAGEIVLKPASFSGYWNNPEANEAAFLNGWFRTGDEGVIDAEGKVTIIGRFKEVINSGGAKVSPYEVEAVLRQHPDVKDVAVFGLRHQELGEVVAAAVVGSVSERELRKFASERLPFYKVPMRIIPVETIPTGVSGKVQRNRLAEALGLK